MKKILSIITLAVMMMTVSSCDKIEDPLKPYTPTSGGKTVLIKDFTGARCVNCPEAAEVAHELQHQLGEDRVFIMSVHAGFLAQPLGNFPDFITEEGTAWYNNNSSNPLFSVDQVSLTDGNTLFVEQIDKPVSDGLAEPQLFEVSIENDYNESTRQLTVNNTFSVTAESDANYYATVCLLEDSIVGRQVVPGGIDTTYVFRNVFRGTLNGVDGESVSHGPVYVNDAFTMTRDITVDPAYNADQCYVITYIYDYESGKIIQTAMKKIK